MGCPDWRSGALDLGVLALAFETSSDGVSVLSPDGTLLVTNASGAALMGFDSPAAPVGLNWVALFDEVQRGDAQAALEAACRGERRAFRSFRPTRTGLPAWWDMVVTPVPGPGGTAERLLVIARDITDQHRAEQAAARSERLFQTLVDATSGIIWLRDAASDRVEWRGWERFTGQARAPDDRAAWMDAIHPDDRERVDGQARDMRAGVPVRAEYRLLARGQWRWVEDHGVPLGQNRGGPGQWVGLISDIHDRRMAEAALREEGERLRLALDSASLGTWEVDLATGERRWSPEARRMIGIAPDVALDPATLLDLVHPDDRDRVAAERQANMAQRSGTTSVRFRILDGATGETRWIAARGRVVFDHEGRSIRRVGTFEDFTERKRTRDTLQRTLRRYKALLDATTITVWSSDAGQVSCEREGWTAFTGLSGGKETAEWLAAVYPEDRAKVVAARDKALRDGKAYTQQYRLRHAGGGWRWVSDAVVPMHRDDGVIEGWVGVISDIHDRRIAEAGLRTSEERLRLAIESTGMGTWDVNILTGERDWSPEFHALLRLPRGGARSRLMFLSRVHPDDRARVRRELDPANGMDDRTMSSTFRVQFETGEIRWMEARERVFMNEDGRPARRVGTIQDVSDRKQAEAALWRAAHADALTGIANRTLFQLRLDQAVEGATGLDARVCLLVVDLDRFKEVNDVLGHDAGDAVLRAVAARLVALVPPGATVARLGGDEFSVILPAGSGQPDALAATLVQALRQPVGHLGREIDCSGTIGWAAYPDHDPEPGALLKNADLALYAAKAAGRSGFAGFAPAMREAMLQQANGLRGACGLRA